MVELAWTVSATILAYASTDSKENNAKLISTSANPTPVKMAPLVINTSTPTRARAR